MSLKYKIIFNTKHITLSITTQVILLIAFIISIITLLIMPIIMDILDKSKSIRATQIQQIKDQEKANILLIYKERLEQVSQTPEGMALDKEEAKKFLDRFKKRMLPYEKVNTAPLVDFRNTYIRTVLPDLVKSNLEFLPKERLDDALFKHPFILTLSGTSDNVLAYMQNLEAIDIYLFFESLSFVKGESNQVTASIGGYILQLSEDL